MIAISQQSHQRPSSIIGLDDDYEAFCLDEACTYIVNKLQDENAPKPRFIDDEQTNKTNNNDVIEWLNTNNKK